MLEDDYGMIGGIINNGDRRKDDDEKKHSVIDIRSRRKRKRLRWQRTMHQSQKKQLRNRKLNKLREPGLGCQYRWWCWCLGLGFFCLKVSRRDDNTMILSLLLL